MRTRLPPTNGCGERLLRGSGRSLPLPLHEWLLALPDFCARELGGVCVAPPPCHLTAMDAENLDFYRRKLICWREDRHYLPGLPDFVRLYLAYGAETVSRTGFLMEKSTGGARLPAGLDLHRDFVDRLSPRHRARFLNYGLRRCMFSFLADTTTLNLADKLRNVRGADLLYNSLLSHFVLNSPEDFDAFGGPFSLATPLIPAVMGAEDFVEKWRESRRVSKERALGASSSPPPAGGTKRKRGTDGVGASVTYRKLSVSRALGCGVKDIFCHCRPLSTADTGDLTRDIPAFVEQLGSGGRVGDLWNRSVAASGRREEGDSKSDGRSSSPPPVDGSAAVLAEFRAPVWGVARTRKDGKGSKGLRGLPPFAAYVAARFVGIFDARFGDWDHSFELGQYAVLGLLELLGVPEAHAAALSRESRAEVGAAISRVFRALVVSLLPNALRTTGRGRDIVETLDAMGLAPLAAVTVEHMLCEFRKVNARSARISTNPKQRTPSHVYEALWRRVHPLYAARMRARL
jgi:hypothetical protein